VKNKVAEKIRMERLRLNLSQQNMADELGITIAAYSNLERGVTEISISRLNIIAAILQQPIVYFLSEDQMVNEPSSSSYQTKSFSGDLTQQVYMLIKEVQQLQSDVRRIDLELAEVRGA
jgi:transcriptional regulator with XRE-family HTH domain